MSDETRVPDGWKGTPPAEGTRRALIRDTIGETLEGAEIVVKPDDRPFEGDLPLALANRIEEALLGASFRHDESDVPRGTKELHIVLAPNPDANSPQKLFVELEDQGGRGLGGFGRRREGELTRIVIPYGRDNAWVTELAYQVAGAATRPLLEDHPDYVFPAERVQEAVAYLLETYFGIPRACGPCREEQIEQGRKEVPGPMPHFRRAMQGLHEGLHEERSAIGRAVDKEVGLDREAELLEQREEARTGEARFAEERDCAFALLRWLLPVTVAKRIDWMSTDRIEALAKLLAAAKGTNALMSVTRFVEEELR